MRIPRLPRFARYDQSLTRKPLALAMGRVQGGTPDDG